jgi:hypothetical protein
MSWLHACCNDETPSSFAAPTLVEMATREEKRMADRSAQLRAMRWLAQQFEWERTLTALRDARRGEQAAPERRRPAA